MKISTSTLFYMYTRFLRNFCGRYLVDKVLCGRYLVDIRVFFWWSIFDKTPLASLQTNSL